MAKDDLLQCALIIVMKQAWIESSVFLLLVDHDEGAVFMLSVLFYVTFTTYEIIYPFPFTFIVYFKELRYVVVWQTVVMLYWSPLNLKSR
ncbi:hypothetical protein L6164_003862 [Bauhinia variegata]|uniref:Uncharacterized protein n=1 Tax=Bauhinia variegata TaxID=167791 RepID=A0ACB9Q214_BAUVA|nr:hypothetical protein L6164_003862 [Bauhinia variegata]